MSDNDWRQNLKHLSIGVVCVPMLPVLLVLFLCAMTGDLLRMFGERMCDLWEWEIRPHTPFRRKPPTPTTPEEARDE